MKTTMYPMPQTILFSSINALSFQFHPQLCDLEAFRQRHLQLCKLSEKLDHMHSAYVLVTFVIDIPSIVILISVRCLNLINIL